MKTKYIVFIRVMKVVTAIDKQDAIFKVIGETRKNGTVKVDALGDFTVSKMKKAAIKLNKQHKHK